VGAVVPLNPPSTEYRIPIIWFPHSSRRPHEETGTRWPPGEQIEAGLPAPPAAATMTVEEEGKSRLKSSTRQNHALIEAGEAGSAAFASPPPRRKNRRRVRRASGDAREHPSPEIQRHHASRHKGKSTSTIPILYMGSASSPIPTPAGRAAGGEGRGAEGEAATLKQAERREKERREMRASR